MDRRDFIALLKRMKVGERATLERACPGHRTALSIASLALERRYRTNLLANGQWRIERKR